MMTQKQDDMIFGTFIITIALIVAVIIFVCIPVSLYANAKCLRDGYPESRVTVGLEIYCVSLDGAVTVVVDKQ